MNIARFQYKCRKCEEIVEQYETAAKRADFVLLNAIHNILLSKELQPNLIEIHYKCHGLMDLIGYKVYKEMERTY